MRTKTDELRARLARLEKLAGKGTCPSCRLFARITWVDETKPRPTPKDPSLIVNTQCEDCGSPSKYDLSAYPEDVREVMRLYCTSGLEDVFTNHRVWAAYRWMIHWGEARRTRRKVARGTQKLAEADQPGHQRQQSGYPGQMKEREQSRKNDPDVKLYNKLVEEADSLSARQRRRLERQYGEHPFPELEARVEAAREPDYDRLYRGEPFAPDVPFSIMFELKQEAKSWLVCAEMEKVVLGDVTPATTGEIADCERRVRELMAGARAKHEARQEKRRQDEAERERQRLGRISR